MFFDKAFRGEIILIVSDLLEEELNNAPTDIKTFFKTLPSERLEFVKLTKDSIELAELYIVEKVVGETSRADCRHIALATINKADVLIRVFSVIVNCLSVVGRLPLPLTVWRLAKKRISKH